MLFGTLNRSRSTEMKTKKIFEIYGPEWHAAVMKMRKADIIDRLLKPALIAIFIKSQQSILTPPKTK